MKTAREARLEINIMRGIHHNYCCQGAEECEGLRLNAEGKLEFILYLNGASDINNAAIAWHTCINCPLCGCKCK